MNTMKKQSEWLWEETAKDLVNIDSDIYKYKQQEHHLLKAFFSILCFEGGVINRNESTFLGFPLKSITSMGRLFQLYNFMF